jgi:hypothetical protein
VSGTAAQINANFVRTARVLISERLSENVG